jgi:hypothetical protein
MARRRHYPLIVLAIMALVGCSPATQARQDLRTAWDQGERPDHSAVVTAGQTAPIPVSGNLKWYWPECHPGDECPRPGSLHYPVIYRPAALKFADGCFIITPGTVTRRVAAAANVPHYRLELSAQGLVIRLCTRDGGKGTSKNDQVAIWALDG